MALRTRSRVEYNEGRPTLNCQCEAKAKQTLWRASPITGIKGRD